MSLMNIGCCTSQSVHVAVKLADQEERHVFCDESLKDGIGDNLQFSGKCASQVLNMN